jgi:hypothetical protein
MINKTFTGAVGLREFGQSQLWSRTDRVGLVWFMREELYAFFDECDKERFGLVHECLFCFLGPGAALGPFYSQPNVPFLDQCREVLRFKQMAPRGVVRRLDSAFHRVADMSVSIPAPDPETWRSAAGAAS